MLSVVVSFIDGHKQQLMLKKDLGGNQGALLKFEWVTIVILLGIVPWWSEVESPCGSAGNRPLVIWSWVSRHVAQLLLEPWWSEFKWFTIWYCWELNFWESSPGDLKLSESQFCWWLNPGDLKPSQSPSSSDGDWALVIWIWVSHLTVFLGIVPWWSEVEWVTVLLMIEPWWSEFEWVTLVLLGKPWWSSVLL
jgi:hypothetical protein